MSYRNSDRGDSFTVFLFILAGVAFFLWLCKAPFQ